MGMKEKAKVESLSDTALLRSLSDLNRQSRRVEADIVAHIAEVDARRLYAREAKSSMHVYCVEVLEFTDFEAYLRITAARATRNYPELLDMLRDGRLHLTAVARLASHLTSKNWKAVLGRAAHRSKREIEELIAELAPRPDVPSRMRKLPTRGNTPVSQIFPLVPERVPERVPPAAPAPSPLPRSRRTSVEPLALTSYKVQFTASQELHDKLERLQARRRWRGTGDAAFRTIESRRRPSSTALQSPRTDRRSPLRHVPPPGKGSELEAVTSGRRRVTHHIEVGHRAQPRD
jgi:hypothetical protein